MGNSQNIKTIVVDLDRTLLHTDKSLSSYTVEVLKRCKAQGIKVMVATARPLRTAQEYCDQIDCDAVTVSNGAKVFCGNRIIQYGICQESALHLLSILTRHPSLLITLETGSVAYSNRPIADYETVITDDLVSTAKAKGALKILVRLDDEETLKIVRSALTDDLYYTIANGHLIQIMNKSATKWNGIRAMLTLNNCNADETAYFGDDNDDIEPLKMCGLGIAVSNAIEEVKSVADRIAKSNDEDGVARLIAEILFGEE